MTENTISQYIKNSPGATANVRDNFPIVLDFLQAYYAWMETSGEPISGIFSLLDNRDVDSTLNGFLSYFRYEFLPNIPATIIADPKKLLKHAKDFYLARGSEKSFALLFRILYNDSVLFYYPKTDLIKPSDGKWSVDTIVRCTTVNDTYKFIGRQIVGHTSQTIANVENVVKISLNNTIISEIYISNITGRSTFQIGEKIDVLLSDGTIVQETLYGLATGINIIDTGTAYISDDIIITAKPTNGSAAIFSVDAVDGIENGRVVQANFGNFITLPTIELSSNASSTDNFYQDMFITITDGSGGGQTRLIVSYDGTHKLESLGNIKTIKVKDFGYNYTTPISANFSLSGNGDALGNISIGSVGRYAGRYVNPDGFLSNKNKIQDSYYYQDFSYVLKVHETLDQYRDVVKQLLHPAGLALFGDVVIDGTLFTRKIHSVSGSINISTS
jgi:hypothetical protein